MLERKLACILAGLVILMAACQPAATPFQCADALGCVKILPGEPLKLGVLQTLSGGSAPAGIEQERSIRLALAQYGNMLLGHPIELKVEDERCSAEGGANAVLPILADPQVVGILGTNCSSAAVTAGKAMSQKGLVMISSANTSPLLTAVGAERGPDWTPGYFRTSWNDTAMGKAAAQFAAQQLGLRKAAVINAGDAYSKGLTDVFSQAFQALGGQVTLNLTIDEDETDQSSMLEAVQLSGAELIFFPLSHPEAGSRIVHQAKAMPGLKNLTFIAGEGMLSDVFIQDVGADGVGVYIQGPGAPSSAANTKLFQTYNQQYGQPPQSFYYSFAYDAANLLLTAIRKVAVQQDGTLYIGRQALRQALYATRDFDGLTGKLTCDQFGDCGVATLNVVRLDASTVGAEALRSNVVFTYTAPVAAKTP